VLVKDFSYGILKGAEFLEDRIGGALIVGELALDGLLFPFALLVLDGLLFPSRCWSSSSLSPAPLNAPWRLRRAPASPSGSLPPHLRLPASFVRGVSRSAPVHVDQRIARSHPVHRCLLLCLPRIEKARTCGLICAKLLKFSYS